MSSDKTALGDRIKNYESIYSHKCIPFLPVIARLDGKAFHTWTHDLERPFDKRLVDLFVETTKWLVEETQPRVGYTQSDEITLIWYSDDIESQIFFDGKINKMISVLASMTAAKFNKLVEETKNYSSPRIDPKCIAYFKPNSEGGCKHRPLAFFDCRVFQVPNLDEAANVLVWRELDATRNSIQMAAQSQFSHKQLQNKNTSELQEMLFSEKGINWNDYPDFFKRGTYVFRRKETRRLTDGEYWRIPEKHRDERDALVERSTVRSEVLPKITSIVNRVDVFFKGETPIVKDV